MRSLSTASAATAARAAVGVDVLFAPACALPDATTSSFNMRLLSKQTVTEAIHHATACARLSERRPNLEDLPSGVLLTTLRQHKSEEKRSAAASGSE